MSRVDLDRWDVVHLLLSIDERPRSPIDARDLRAALARTVDALRCVAPAPPVTVPVAWTEPLRVEGHPGWIMETNSWLLVHDGSCVVVDVPPEPQSLLARIRELGVTPIAVVLTHGHVDHAGGVAELLDELGASVPVHVSRADRRLVLEPSAGGALAAAIGRMFTRPPSCVLEDPVSLRLGPAVIRPMAVRGHTPGSIGLLVEGTARPLLLAGDALFAGGTGRCDLPEGQRTVAERSLRRLLGVLDDQVVVLPGHGGLTTVGAERSVRGHLRR